MKSLAAIALTLVALGLPRLAWADKCRDYGYVRSVIGNGRFVETASGTLIEIQGIDTIDTNLWLMTENLVLCDGRRLCKKEFSGKLECAGIKQVWVRFNSPMCRPR